MKIGDFGHKYSKGFWKRAAHPYPIFFGVPHPGRPAKRPLLFNDRSEDEESLSLGIDPSFFEKSKYPEVVMHLNFFRGPE